LTEKTPNQDVDGSPSTHLSDANSGSEQDIKPLETEGLDSSEDNSLDGDIVDAQIFDDAEEVIDAEVIEAIGVDDELNEDVKTADRSFMDMPPRAHVVQAVPVSFNQRKLQTKGGAIGGVLLGTLSIVGAFLTGYSLINAVLGLMLSAWGLNSGAKKTAKIGLLLSAIGVGLSFAMGLNR